MTPANTLTGAGARAGYPQLTVPAGYTSTQRRPVNISFNGTAYSEQTLLALGHAYEQATKLRAGRASSTRRCTGAPNTKPPSVYGAHCVCARARAAEAGREGAEAAVLARAGLDRDLQRRMARAR